MVLIDVDRIEDGLDLRAYRDDAFEDVLKRDLEMEGQVIPILVRELNNGRYEALDLTRFRLLKQLGYKQVDCKILRISEQQAIITSLKMNLLRKSHDAMGVARTLKLLHDKHKMRVVDLALAFHFSKGHVSKLLKLNKLSLEDQDRLAHGELTIGQAYALVRGKPIPERIKRETSRKCRFCLRELPFEEIELTVMCRECRALLALALEKKARERKRHVKEKEAKKAQRTL